jgi:uncharacterized protein YfaS (alpha-2-macroglobulin family)
MFKLTRIAAVASLVVTFVAAAGLAVFVQAPKPDRAKLDQLVQAGNFKDAYEGYRRLALDPRDEPRLVGSDLARAIECLARLGRAAEIDEFREKVIEMHGGNWRLLVRAAMSLQGGTPYGSIIAGKFYRGDNRGNGQFVSAQARDRVQALQLLVQAIPDARRDADKASVWELYVTLAQILSSANSQGESWRFQSLTDLKQLPDYEPWNYGFGRDQVAGAPVELDGTPVFYRVPKSFEAATNDGERWRWALAQAGEADPAKLNTARWMLATFLQQQFGVHTILPYDNMVSESDVGENEDAGPFALGTLTDEETVARLATGIKRFKLPDEFNPIKAFRAIADDPKTGYGREAVEALASVYESRQQLDKAADFWKRSVRQFGNTPGASARIDQILGNWGQFEPNLVQPAGQAASLGLRYRNGRHVDFEAYEIRFGQLLEDVKAYLKSNTPHLDWNQVNVADIGFRLVERQELKYLGREVARWGLDLQPRKGHLDARVTVTTPLKNPGGYLVRARMQNGNVSRIVVWLDDTVIVKKPMNGKTFFFVADAVTGKPIPNARLEFFAYRQEQIGNTPRYRIVTNSFERTTDGDGLSLVDADDAASQYQWMITARAEGGRFAHLGFTNVWRAAYYDAEYQEDKVFAITDRPVYRPKQVVKFKLWVRHAKYDQADTSSFAGQDFPVEIQNPKGEKVFKASFKADAYGGFDGEFELPSDATLGVYGLVIPNRGGGSFRVEEYKKPEFEVTVEAPTKPVMLGEKIVATIRAKYYFGTPVTEARVKYKITRTAVSQTWYPAGTWDWFYGPGYWWFVADYPWYPGWHRWGCRRPMAWWWPHSQAPPEVIAQAELPIGRDGSLPVTIDTAVAKEIHGNQDHRYEITAEVVDQSRRTIVGTGSVLVAREPFKVYAWVDRGYYRIGDTIHASVSAQTLDRKPVSGKGTMRLLKVSYDPQGKPVETSVGEWPLETNDRGQAEQTFKASASGQFRIAATIRDSEGHTIEGGYLLTVRGDAFNGREFHFNDLELIADQREYKPGDKAKLMINANRAGGAVLLFVRPANGVYLAPKVIRLDGKSALEEIDVVKKDMPNFFVEALTISDGKLHSEIKEIVVPPESRVLNVEVKPSKTTYKPGQKARVEFKLTESDGKPFVGSTVVSVYDKAVDYIAGGSNVSDIKEFFWKWRRSHYPQNQSSLDRSFANQMRSNEVGMQLIGLNIGPFVEGWNGWGYGAAGFRGERSRASRTAFMAAPAGATMSAGPHKRRRLAAGVDEMAAGMPADKAIAADFAEEPAAAPQEVVAPTVRKNFADTAYWAAAIQTGQDGSAEVDVDLPESLTTWKVNVWGMGHGTKVGQGAVEVITAKDLLVRLQAPRFFVQKDEVVLSANVHNALPTKKSVQVVLELEGGTLTPLGESVQTIEVASRGEQRVDWRVKVAREGEAVIRMKALTDEESDAMEMRFPVYVHGMLKTESWAGAIRPEGEAAALVVRVPSERRPEQTRLEIHYSPTLAGAMVDALPYLADYPYGCTEQTLNRFLPSVITQKILLDMGLDLKAIREKRTNLNAQELGDPAQRAKKWKRLERNPVFDPAELATMVKAGLDRLTEMQLSDGGWGWFSGYGEHSFAHTTALVVHGLQIAQRNDVAIPPGVLERGVGWLTQYQNSQLVQLENFSSKKHPAKENADDLDAFVFLVLTDTGVTNARMLEFLDRDRTHLSVYAKAMFGLALVKLDEKEKLSSVLKNMTQYLVQDDENQTAYLKLPNEGSWWFWYGNDVEANAYYLKLLARTDPKSETAARLAKYLVNNRAHGRYWNSTRDTAICIEALADFLKASGEDKPDLTVAIALDGKPQKEVRVNAANLFAFDNTLALEGPEVTAGEHTISVRKQGSGALYFNAYLTNFTLEDPIVRAGLEIKVNRQIYKLIPQDKAVDAAGSRGQAVSQKVESYRREPFADLATLKSGDLVEVELEIDSKNDYEYVIFEDMKAAGFEPADLRSGYNGNALGAYMELRDERVAFFVRSLARGKHSVAYRLRAEIPGRFSALPARAYAMYAPELKANSDEIKLNITD